MSTSVLSDMNVMSHPATSAADMFNGNLTTDVLNMTNYGSIVFVLQKGAGAVGTATITVESCDDTSATTSTAVGFTYQASTVDAGNTWAAAVEVGAAGFTTTAGANQAYLIEIRDDQLSGTDGYVRAVFTETANAAVEGGVVSIGRNAKYPQGIQKEMIT